MDADIRWSRQWRVFGEWKLIADSSIALIGCGGLGLEIAKNLALVGVGHIHWLYSNLLPKDFSSIYLPQWGYEADRTAIFKSELQTNVKITPISDSSYITKEYLQANGIKVVIATTLFMQKATELNSTCRAAGVKFILGLTAGPAGIVFCDFNSEFEQRVRDAQTPIPILSINKKEGSIQLTLLSELFSDGDIVSFARRESLGNDDLPQGEFTIIEAISNTFEIQGNFDALSEYKGNAFMYIKERTQKGHHISLQQFLHGEKWKDNRDILKHYTFSGFLSLEKFFNSKNAFPRPYNNEDAQLFCDLGDTASDANYYKFQKQFCKLSSGHLIAIDSMIAGFMAQEALKAITGKYMPICSPKQQKTAILYEQCFYFESVETLFDGDLTEEDCITTERHIAGQVAVIGTKRQAELENMKALVAGAGAVGCEVLKNLATMGIGTRQHGKLVVVDYDLVSTSNLVRQFLFTEDDVKTKKNKALAAANRIKQFNSNIDIQPFPQELKNRTQDTFNHDFWRSLNIIFSAVDSTTAREYLDEKAHCYSIPFLEGGTKATECSSVTVLPFLTAPYGQHFALSEPQNCLPKGILGSPVDVVQYCVNTYLLGIFKHMINDIHLGIEVSTRKILMESLKSLQSTPQKQPMKEWSIMLFRFIFEHEIKNLPDDEQFKADVQRAAENGDELVLKLCKNLPKPIFFNNADELHQQFIEQTTKLLSFILIDSRLTPLEFEKDDNEQMQWVYVTSKILSKAYSIPPVENFEEVRHIAGKIVPAIITTTAIAAGYMCLNLLKFIRRGMIKQCFKMLTYNTATGSGSFTHPLKDPHNLDSLPKTVMFPDSIGKNTEVEDIVNWLQQTYNVNPKELIIETNSIMIYRPQFTQSQKVLSCLQKSAETLYLPQYFMFSASVGQGRFKFRICVKLEP